MDAVWHVSNVFRCRFSGSSAGWFLKVAPVGFFTRKPVGRVDELSTRPQRAVFSCGL